METVRDVICQQAANALQALSIQDAALADEVTESILQQTVYWEKPLPGSERLLFVRLFSPVVMREEVFLGNVLFNAFLGQTFARAVTQSGGQAAPLANDLENYYFLVRTSADLSALAETFRVQVEHSLPDLFFGEPDPARGIYGSVETMLDFDKANVEPFPVFIMPQAYAARLEKAVRDSLLHKIEKSAMDRNPTSIMANLAFFYSHDGAEMQSPYLFLVRLATRYGIVDLDEFSKVLFLDAQELTDESAAKKATEEALKQKNNRTFSPKDLRILLRKVVLELGKRVDAEPEKWRMPYISGKFLQVDERMLAEELLAPVRLGYIPFSVSSAKKSCIPCRLCGVRIVEAEDKSILMGQNTHRFHNQSSKQKDEKGPKACLRCATCTYLMVKLLGSEAVGQPQVPKSYNLIFHYGRHSDAEVARLAQWMDRLWELIREHRDAEDIYRKVNKARQELAQKAEQEKDDQKRADLQAKVAQKEAELRQAQETIAKVEEDIFANCPWMRDLGAIPVPSENPALDILGNLQLSESKVERHVLDLGMGGYRMILFVLPQIRAPRDKERDFAQSRFSNSWITVTAFLSFLHNLCGCDGPFYYQSLPALTPEAFQPGMFYIRNRLVSAQEAQSKYVAVYQLAWQLVRQRGPEGFVKKVMLAERLLADPLGTFSTVMRDSPILGQRKGGYKKLKIEYRHDWGAQDLTEYARFIQQLANL